MAFLFFYKKSIFFVRQFLIKHGMLYISGITVIETIKEKKHFIAKNNNMFLPFTAIILKLSFDELNNIVVIKMNSSIHSCSKNLE